MKIKIIAAVISAALIMTGCANRSNPDTDLPQEEREFAAVTKWFTDKMTDEDSFPDVKEYRYYSRAIGLDRDARLSMDMWEVYYSNSININREIDGKAIYLIRLNPGKLLDVYAANNNGTPETVCAKLSVTLEQFYYNFGYTATAVNYTKSHKDNLVGYSAKEAEIFGADNGEKRETVLSTHFLLVDTANYSVTYKSEIPELTIKQRDLLRSTTKQTYDYSSYTENEKNPAFTVNGIGIRRVLPLSIPNGWNTAADKDITVMFNQSPFSYGCTDNDRIFPIAATDETAEENESEAAE